MRTLYLMRHAKSSWKNPDLEDRERPLNKRGKRDVPLMGKRLNASSVHLDHIVCSDARRALDTAIPIGESIGLDRSDIEKEPLLYNASKDRILNIIKGLENDWHRVMLVGHNPGLHEVVNLFYTPPLPKFPTAAVVALGFEIDTWQELDSRRLVYRDFDFPKKV